MDRINDKVKQYLSKRKQYINAVTTPIDPNCKLAIVVPAYNEANYIGNLLKSLDAQKEIDFNVFEVHILVNNSNGANEKIIDSNAKTYKKALDWSKKSKYKIFVRDFFSQNKAFSAKKHTVGLIRDIGYAECINRFNKINENGIIVSTDADTCVSQFFVKEILQLFNSQSDVIAYRGLIYYDRSHELQGGNKYWAYHELDAYFSSVIKQYLKTHIGDFKYSAPAKFKFAGANSGARSIETALAGGIPHLGGREDVHFGYNLAKIGRIVEANTIVAYPSTRLEQRVLKGTGTGHKASDQIHEALENNALMTYTLSSYVNAREIELRWESVLGKKIAYNEMANIFTLDNKQLIDSDVVGYLSNENPKINSWEDISKNDQLRNIQLSLIKNIGKKEPIGSVLDALENKYKELHKDFDILLQSKLHEQITLHRENCNKKINLLMNIVSLMDNKKTNIREEIISVVANKIPESQLDYLAKDRFAHSRDISFLIYALENGKELRQTLKNLYFPSEEPFSTINKQAIRCLALKECQASLLSDAQN